MPPLLRTLLAAALLLSLGCGGGGYSPRTSYQIAQRLIEEPPARVFHLSSLERIEQVRSWDFAKDREWTAPLTDVSDRFVTAGRTLTASKNYQSLERRVDLRASEFATFELVTGRTKGASFTLHWARDGEGFAQPRSLRVPASEIPRQRRQVVFFDLREHPLWEGRIRRLRIGIGAPAQRNVLLRHLKATTASTDPELLAATLSRPWQLDLEGDTRASWLTVPDIPVQRPVAALPRGARLRFAWSVPREYPETCRIDLTWHPEGEPARRLFEHQLEASEAGRWNRAEIDLAPEAGRAGKLAFTVTGASPERVRSAGLAAWASPEILRPLAGDRPPNVVLISIDTLRADRLSSYGYRLPTTPRLDAWAERAATLFENTIASAPWTLPGHASMFTGVNALHHGANHDAPLAGRYETLAESLRSAGYRTRAVTAAGFLVPQYGTAQGFDRFDYYRAPQQEVTPELEVNLGRAYAALDEMATEPFFLFFHTYETHAPYRPRQPWFQQLHGYPPPGTARPEFGVPEAEEGFVDRRVPGRPLDESATDDRPFGADRLRTDGGEDLARISSDLYDSSVAYMDHYIGEFIERIEALGPALIVLTSDHGEMLGEHGLAGHAYLYDENLKVPLIIAAPSGVGAGQKIAAQARSVDLAPTVLDLLGLPRPAGLDGRSLAPSMRGDRPAGPEPKAWSYAANTNRGLSFRLRNRLKVIYDNSVWPPVAGAARAYDLRQDPSEDSPTPPPAEALEELRTTFSELPGFWLTLNNPTAAPLHLRLEGSMITTSSLKSVALNGAELRLTEPEAANILLPAGGRSRLRMEVVPQGTLRVTTLTGGPKREARIHPRNLGSSNTLTWAWQRELWRPLDPGEKAAGVPTMQAEWVGEESAPDRTISDQDAELRENLRALGYID
ncbi:MAG: sulfatase [Acidobacteriota bacterium]